MQMFSSFLRYIQRYEEVTTASKTCITNTKYGANCETLLTFTLPTISAVGDMITVVGIGTGGWQVAQNASQYIYVGSGATTTGVTGYIASTNAHDVVELTCTVANVGWTTTQSMGSITVA